MAATIVEKTMTENSSNQKIDMTQMQAQLDTANAYIEELQMKVAFQEHTIEALNEALSSQQKQLPQGLNVYRNFLS